ncbi:methyltransferase domain-containing protein [Catellatospora sp. KI3]|uniref:class I SAM-dependent methyltransferase n=1 Tax=Catellatospora sp. KI3 TaxID=3041620 RepID=UPI00248298E6|nr:methyltransferase domain-containing protein [Catellatospora sp. KI3]MDI1460784.1 methyltransferase domain-containing protein [Catellatospora sp. KI3]
MTAAPATWWTTFFTEIYVDSDIELRDDAVADDMSRCVTAALRLEPGARLLDLACGTGRHAVRLSAAGFTVTGVDLVEEYLDRARLRAQAAHQPARFVQADMRDLRALEPGSFDAVVSLHTSFGFFPSHEENAGVLREIHRVLAPGGKVLIDVMNRDWFLRQTGVAFGVDQTDFVIRNFDSSTGRLYLHEERFDPATSRIRWEIRSVGDQPRTVAADYRVYSAHELMAMLAECGFAPTAVWGDYDLSPFSIHSPHIICVATAAAGRA